MPVAKKARTVPGIHITATVFQPVTTQPTRITSAKHRKRTRACELLTLQNIYGVLRVTFRLAFHTHEGGILSRYFLCFQRGIYNRVLMLLGSARGGGEGGGGGQPGAYKKRKADRSILFKLNFSSPVPPSASAGCSFFVFLFFSRN